MVLNAGVARSYSLAVLCVCALATSLLTSPLRQEAGAAHLLAGKKQQRRTRAISLTSSLRPLKEKPCCASAAAGGEQGGEERTLEFGCLERQRVGAAPRGEPRRRSRAALRPRQGSRE